MFQNLRLVYCRIVHSLATAPSDSFFQTFLSSTREANLGTFVQADVNNDGKADVIGTRSLVAPKPNFQIVVLLGNGTGGFGAPVVTPITGVDQSFSYGVAQPFVTGEFNDDGRVDVAVLGKDHVTGQLAIAVLLGNGDGAFQAGKETIIGATGGTPSTQQCVSTVGDYNGDGKLDLAYTSSSGVVVLPGKGDGTFSLPCSHGADRRVSCDRRFPNDDKKLGLSGFIAAAYLASVMSPCCWATETEPSRLQ